MSDFTARCEREGKWWVVTVLELESGRVTQARRLDQVDEVVRSLVRLMTGEEADAVHLEVILPEDLTGEVDRAREMRERAEREARESAALARSAARKLAESGMTARDIGKILGVSFQRAAQFLAAG